MIEYCCPKCKEKYPVPNVLKCPFCNKDMSGYTDELTKKHLIRCSAYMNPYIYSDLPACRPKNEVRKKMLRDMYDL